MHAVGFSYLLRLATNNIAPCHKRWVDGVYTILIKSESARPKLWLHWPRFC